MLLSIRCVARFIVRQSVELFAWDVHSSLIEGQRRYREFAMKTRLNTIWPFIIFPTIAAAILTIHTVRKSRIRAKGLFLIANKIGISSGGKNGASSDYIYHYHGRVYNTSIRDFGKGDSFIVVGITREAPASCVLFNEEKVPPCLQNDSSLNKTWTAVPYCQ